MRRQGIGLSDLVCGFALVVALFVFLAPVLWMLITAVKPPGEWLNEPPVFIPSELHWANFTDALFKWGGLKGLTDSLIVASLSTVLSLLLGVPAAYAIGRYQTGGDNLSFTVLSILFQGRASLARGAPHTGRPMPYPRRGGRCRPPAAHARPWRELQRRHPCA